MDSGEVPGVVVVVFIIIAVVGVVVSRIFDSDRVRSYIEGQRGGQLLEKRWTPFGRGWYGDNNRIYEVRYLDRDGNEHRATRKTSLFSGVYFTDDEIIAYAKPPENVSSLRQENERLRAELERLRRNPRGDKRSET